MVYQTQKEMVVPGVEIDYTDAILFIDSSINLEIGLFIFLLFSLLS